MTYTITVKLSAPSGQAIGIKEHMAMELERFGPCRVVEVREEPVEQMKIGGSV